MGIGDVIQLWYKDRKSDNNDFLNEGCEPRLKDSSIGKLELYLSELTINQSKPKEKKLYKPTSKYHK